MQIIIGLFVGDSRYGIHYKQLAAVFGRLDNPILEIGAYKPACFMSAKRYSPSAAVGF